MLNSTNTLTTIKAYVKSRKMLRASVYDFDGMYHRLTICQTWQLVRHHDQTDLQLYRYDYQDKCWQLITWQQAPSIKLISYHYGWIYRIFEQAFIHLTVSLYSDHHLGQNLFNSYIWYIDKIKEQAAKSIIKYFYAHFYNKRVMSLVCAALYRKDITLKKYLLFATYQQGAEKVFYEHRNLLPLLLYLKPEYWGRDDLFSRKIWVKDGRKRTLLDRKIKAPESKLASVNDARTWRWLLRTSNMTIKYWLTHPSMEVLHLLSIVQTNKKIPVIAYSLISLCQFRFKLESHFCNPNLKYLLHAYFVEAHHVWQTQSYDAVKHWVKEQMVIFFDVVDHLHFEGFGAGLPHKHSTWQSLLQRTHAWHENLYQAEISQYSTTNWVDPHETIIDGVRFTALTNAQMLFIEGKEMHHCVVSYAEDCTQGHYRVYSMMELATDIRSTLGIFIDNNQHAQIEQHRGKYNGNVSNVSSNAAKKFIARYKHKQIFI